MKFLQLLAFCFIVLVSCKKTNESSTAVSANASSEVQTQFLSIITHTALPAETDSKITTQASGNTTQYASLPANAAQRKDRLFIMIPGTWGLPSNYNNITEYAARSGYYSFAVAYSNLLPVEFQLGLRVNDKSAENVLEEYLTGNNVSNSVRVSKANSLENRILKMILYMDSLYPSENWRRFVTADNKIRWNKLSVAGHSQGSDHAMYMSKKRALFRASFFAGPGNFLLPNGEYPTFMKTTGLTNLDNVYGFNHTKDPTRAWKDVQVTWGVLGLEGAPENIDDGSANNAHQLITSYNELSDYHSGIIVDDLTPLNAQNVPIYEPVWKYMCYAQ